MSTACIIGYGSIGVRHARILGELGQRVCVVSRREIDHPRRYGELAIALEQERPDIIVIATATSEHGTALTQLARLGFAGTVLVEKPLFDQWQSPVMGAFRNVYVAYNLRFHAVLQRLKVLLQGEKVLSVQAYVGQYLPDWRPGTNYRASYSASAAQGGGALRDLSHELDYLVWLFGGWTRVAALGGHFSALEISSDDLFALLLVTQRCPVLSLQMNYLDRAGRRAIIVNTQRQTLEADLVGGTITLGMERESILCGRDDSYRAMHQAILDNSTETLCTLEQGLDTLQLIAAAEAAAMSEQWVAR